MMNLSSICKSIAAVFVAASASLAAATAPAVWDGSVAESFAEGSGTAADPYKISNGAELALFAEKVAAGEVSLCGMLTDDVYLNENSGDYKNWESNPPANNWSKPIGMNKKAYVGKFDGKGHKIYGMYQDIEISANLNSTGLFGWIGSGAVIQNIAVEESYSSSHGNVGSTHNSHNGLLFGAANGSTVMNVQTKGIVHSRATNTDSQYAHFVMSGCLAGYVSDGSSIVNASTSCEVSSAISKGTTMGTQLCLGGLVGKSGKMFVQNAYADGILKNVSETTPDELYIGGVLGYGANAADSLVNTYYNISAENAPENVVGKALGVSLNSSSKTAAKMKTEKFAALLGPAFTFTASLNEGFPQPVVFEGATAFEGGDGSEESPYLIGSAKALRAVSGLVNGMNAEYGNKSYKMTADVELNEDSETYKSWGEAAPEFSWYQIGAGYRRVGVNIDCEMVSVSCGDVFFSGIFDGDGKTITGLYVNDLSGNSQGGLFYVVKNGTVKNLTVAESRVQTKGRAAGIAAVASYAVIDNCVNAADLYSISQDNGGIVGHANYSLITHCTNRGNLEVVNKGVNAWSNGGIAGEIFYESELSYCVNVGNISGVHGHNGGISGLANGSSIHDVYNLGSVKGDSVTGGIVGYLNGASLANSYSVGNVSSANSTSRGGVVGKLVTTKEIVSDSYYDVLTVGSTNAPTAAIGGGTGVVSNASALTTAQMKTGMFAIMLGENFKQDDDLNEGYPVFLAEGETYGAEHLFAGGKGTEDDPYQIATATQLRNMEYLVNKKNALYGDKSYKLIADIALNDNTSEYESWGTKAPVNVWTPMGVDESNSFKGIFDGGNFAISGLYSNAKFSGLFGTVGETGVVKDLTVKESYVMTTYGGGVVGSVAAYSKGIVKNVKNSGEVYAKMTTANSYAYGGGIVGYSNAGSISQIENSGKVYVLAKTASGNRTNTGGVVGRAFNTEVVDVINKGAVESYNVTAGGVIADAYTGGVIGFSYNSDVEEVLNYGGVRCDSRDSATQSKAWCRIGGIVGTDSGSTLIASSDNYGNIYAHTSSATNTAVDMGGILGNLIDGSSKISYCRNEGDLNGEATYSITSVAIGGVVGFAGGVLHIENSYAKGLYTGKSTPTASPKNSSLAVGGIAANMYSSKSSMKGCYFYGNISTNATGATLAHNKGGVAGKNAGSIIGSYFDSEVAGITAVTGTNTGTLTKSKALTTAEMQTNEFAWLLNTLGGDSTNSAAFSRYNSYPVFADKDYLPTYRVVFDDDVELKNVYTSSKGYATKPADPEPAPGEMFVGWTDGDKFMLQNRQVISKDMTLHALFTLVTEPIYSITFIDGKEILVKATETTGKVAKFPTAKNIPMGYHFDGWYDNATNKAVEEDQVFTGTATLIAKFSANLYKITFLDYDETEISSGDVAYGETPKAPKATREHTDEFVYTHVGWTPEVDVVTGEATYTAVYDSAVYVAPTSSSSSAKSSSSSAMSSSSSVIPSSSSSVIPSVAEGSSSSAKSSSSSAKSSSSVKASSSSSASDKKSSSSKGGDKDEKGDAVLVAAQIPQFSVSVAGRTLQIAGAAKDAKVGVFDLRGNVIYAGFAYSANFTVALPRSGSYLVRIGNQVQNVNVK